VGIATSWIRKPPTTAATKISVSKLLCVKRRAKTRWKAS
jgi:hypothetical protein